MGGARLLHGLGDLPGNGTLKDDFVFWVKALPSRAHGAAISQRFELDRLSVRSAIADRLPNATRWAAARRLSGPADYRFDHLGSLLVLKGRSGASPHQSWAISAVSLNGEVLRNKKSAGFFTGALFSKNCAWTLSVLPIAPFTPTVVPTAVAPPAPAIAPVSPAVVPIAPSSQLYAALVGRGLGLFDDRRAYAGDSLRNSRLRRIGGIHFGGSSVW